MLRTIRNVPVKVIDHRLIGSNRLCFCIPDCVDECVCCFWHGNFAVKDLTS